MILHIAICHAQAANSASVSFARTADGNASGHPSFHSGPSSHSCKTEHAPSQRTHQTFRSSESHLLDRRRRVRVFAAIPGLRSITVAAPIWPRNCHKSLAQKGKPDALYPSVGTIFHTSSSHRRPARSFRLAFCAFVSVWATRATFIPSTGSLCKKSS